MKACDWDDPIEFVCSDDQAHHQTTASDVPNGLRFSVRLDLMESEYWEKADVVALALMECAAFAEDLATRLL